MSQPTTDLDHTPRNITSSQISVTSPQSLSDSFLRYLLLPWNDLEAFSAKVNEYESQFKKDTAGKTNADIKRVYLENNVFHIFSHGTNEFIDDLRKQMNLRPVTNDAVELMKQNGFGNINDNEGHSVDDYNIPFFFTELTTRILNLNARMPCVMPENQRGHVPADGKVPNYIKLMPKPLNIIFELKKETSVDDCYQNRMEIYLRYLHPEKVMGANNATKAISRLNFFGSPESEAEISLSPVLDHVMDIFGESINDELELTLACIPQGKTETELSSLDTASLDSNPSEVQEVQTSLSSIFSQTLHNSYGKPDNILQLKNRLGNESPQLSKFSYNLALVEKKYESNLGELATRFFSGSNEANTGQSIGSTITSVKDIYANAVDVYGTETSEDRFRGFLRQTIGYSKKEGCPISILTNGDQLVVFYVSEFHKKLHNYQNSPNEDIFGKFQVRILERNEHPILLALCSILLDGFKDYYNHQKLSNTDVINWYQGPGGGVKKHISDKTKFLINRKVFYELLGDRISFPIDTLKSFNFQWENYLELHDFLGLNHTTVAKVLDNIVKTTIMQLKRSYIWRLFSRSISQDRSNKIEIFESERFQIIEILQNKIFGKHVSATTMHARLNHQIDGVLKIYDTTRMSCCDERFVSFNGVSMKQNFNNIIELSQRMFMNEYVSYFKIGESKDYIPKVLHCGALFIPRLMPGDENYDIYESPFLSMQGASKNVKSDSMFLFMEHISRVKLNDFKLQNMVKTQAIHDLNEIHQCGVYHRDLSSRNIILKKSNETESGYRFVFIDFGLSFISKLSKAKAPLNAIGAGLMKYTANEAKFIDDDHLNKLNYQQRVEMYEKLKEIDQDDLKIAMEDYFGKML